jgi:hypothetical protein
MERDDDGGMMATSTQLHLLPPPSLLLYIAGSCSGSVHCCAVTMARSSFVPLLVICLAFWFAWHAELLSSLLPSQSPYPNNPFTALTIDRQQLRARYTNTSFIEQYVSAKYRRLLLVVCTADMPVIQMQGACQPRRPVSTIGSAAQHLVSLMSALVRWRFVVRLARTIPIPPPPISRQIQYQHQQQQQQRQQ